MEKQKKLHLGPQKANNFKNLKRILNHSHARKYNADFPQHSNNMPKIPETPKHIIIEWELVNIIITNISMLHINNDHVSFNSNKIKEYYEKLNNFNHKYKKSSEIQKFELFNKVYGENGLYLLLLFMDGVKYNNKNDIWTIHIKSFLKYLSQEYEKTRDIYGIDFYNS